MTRAQKKWLKKLEADGFVSMGGWNRGQRNRPLRALEALGYCEFGWGPVDSSFKYQGWNYTPH